MRFPTAKPIDQFPCFLGESIYERLGFVLCLELGNIALKRNTIFGRVITETIAP